MATSGTATFTRTRDQLCASAARKIGAIRAGETMNAAMLNDFAEALNAMVKHWQGTGLHVWTATEATLFLQKAQARYVLGAGGDHATQSYVETSLTAAAAASAATITVSSAAGLAANMYIGIELDSGSWFWTTISGTPTTTVTLATVMSGAAASGNRVVAYTTKITRPLRVVDARRYDFDSGNDVPAVSVIARLDYQGLANKAQAGTVNQVFYDPRGGATTTGLLHAYQVPDDIDDALKFTWWRPIEDFNAAGNNPDLPTEWIRTIVFNLALDMSSEFDVPQEKMVGPAGIATLAREYLDEMKGWDREAESVEFGADMQRY